MVSLQRYVIRLTIIITIILTMIGLIFTSVVINTVQSNVNQIEETKQDYLETDQEILSLLDSVNIQFENVVVDELNLMFENLFKPVEADFADTEESRQLSLDIEQINQLIRAREILDYDLSRSVRTQFFIKTLLRNGLIDTTDIIDDSTTGIATQFREFNNNQSLQILRINEKADQVREDFNDAREKLEDLNIFIDANMSHFQTNLTAFETSLYNNGTSEAQEILEINRFYLQNITAVMTEYSLAAGEVLINPENSSVATLQSTISQAKSSIENIENATIQAGLSSTDTTLYEELQNTTSTLLGTIELGSNDLQGVVTQYENIQSYIDNEIAQLTEDFGNIVSIAQTIVSEESVIFEERTEDYINSLEESLNQTVFFIFVALAAFIAVVFMAIFVTLTLNLGRILSKNQKLAEGDLSVEIKESYSNNEIGLIEESLDIFIEKTKSIIGQIKDTSETLAGISEELAAGSEEASASISDVSENVQTFSRGSSEQNQRLNTVRDQLLEHLKNVETTSHQINEAAYIVSKVATRTNILGLNASIQAAKSGQFGKGFSIVAQEVRELSNETKDSAEDIAASIEDIEINIRRTVQDILEEVDTIRSLAEQTAEGSESTNVATQEQVAMMNEVSDTSAQLAELSQVLNQMMETFTLE